VASYPSSSICASEEAFSFATLSSSPVSSSASAPLSPSPLIPKEASPHSRHSLSRSPPEEVLPPAN